MTLRATVLTSVATALSLVGCFGELPTDDVGSVVAEVQSIPAGVGCLRVVYRAPSATADTTRNLAVTPGAAATLDLGYLPAGTYYLRTSAYNVACGSIVAATVPTWVGEPALANIIPGTATTVPITLRPNVTTRTTLDFVQPVRAIFAGQVSDSTYAIMADGTVRAWGRNDVGQLGDGSTASATRPRVITGILNPVQIAAAGNFACATTESSGLFCWGENYGGQFADGTTVGSLTPRANPDVEPDRIAVRWNQLCGLFAGDVLCWGSGISPGGLYQHEVAAIAFGRGRLVIASEGGYGNTIDLATGMGDTARSGVVGVAGNSLSYCFLTGARTVVCQGNNADGELGDATQTPSSTERSTGLTEVTAIAGGNSHNCALRSTGQVMCWGNNRAGQTGTGLDTPTVNSPAQVPLTNVTQIALGSTHSCALLSDGSVWCWGNNQYGQLGDGTHLTRFAPVRVQF